MTETDDLIATPRVSRDRDADPNNVRPGEWYWVRERTDDGEATRWLGCVVRVGTNYAKLEGPSARHGRSSWSTRVHFDAWDATCTPEPDPETYIRAQVARHQGTTRRLLEKVSDLTARLAISPRQSLGAGDGGETAAIALRGSAEAPKHYEAALVAAKNTTLPKLFEQIQEANQLASQWMTAALLPLEAQAGRLGPVVEAIKHRIHNVQLYAGLSEQAVLVADGSPAALDEPVRLFQRRCYMDEECLARYEAGGMAFADLGEFDAWLTRPENRDRLLPFPRCVVAFRVRRYERRFDVSLSAWISFALSGEGELDKLTFLYVRNGAQVWRIKTTIEFGERLFPDVDHSVLAAGVVYAKYFTGVDDELISEAHYRDLRERYIAGPGDGHRSHDGKVYAWDDFKYKRPLSEARLAEERAARERDVIADEADGKTRLGSYSWVKWDRGNVWFDDVARVVQGQIDRHNQLVTLLQGLCDRSMVFHPHPPWRLWTADGFAAAIRLVYDDSRALVSGDAPDFEAYRRRLNATLAAGTVTVGQEIAWERREAAIENARQAGDSRVRNKSDYQRYRPYGNPGPGRLARAVRVTRDGVQFKWTRPRRSSGYDGRGLWRGRGDEVACSITVKAGDLLNADAYTPGDYRIFFDDPRTRADYLGWAPLLLEAEEYKTGHRTVGSRDADADG